MSAPPRQTLSEITHYLLHNQAGMHELLRQLVLAESPSTDPAAQAPAQALLTRALERAGLSVRIIPGRSRSGGLLFARPQPRSRTRGLPRQLLVGHCDTVWPLGTIHTMPFQTAGNHARGPGSFDMKGGLVQLVFALQTLHDLQLTPPLAPLVLINSDEEIGSVESRPWISRLARIARRAFVLEPALGPQGALKTQRKGAGDFTIHIQGKSAHAGLDPAAGASAILELALVIQKLQALNDPDRGVSVNVGKIDGGIRPNVVAPQSTAWVDVRVLSQADGERVQKAIYELQPTTPGTTIRVEGAIDLPPLEPTPRNRALWHAAQHIARSLGFELTEAVAGGTSDGNLISQYTATLDGLGPVGDGAHAAHEFLDLHRMTERTALLALLLLQPPDLTHPLPLDSAQTAHNQDT